VRCECGECEWNRGGQCRRDVLNVVSTCSVTAPAACDDYVAREEEREG